MPAVTSGKVLVTGASGFIAVTTVKAYLERGYSVRGTVRSQSKGEYLSSLFEKDFPGKFEYVLVRDIGSPDAFDEAVVGVDAIAHTASPVTFPDETVDPSEIIEPAVNGTLNIFSSAAKYGKNVKRVVVTGSVVSVMEPHEGPYVYTTKDWNEWAIRHVQENGKQSFGMVKYVASKTLAEKAVWKFMDENKGRISFDTAIVMPTWVYGPVLQEAKKLEDVNMTVLRLYDFLTNPTHAADPSVDSNSYIDVRDVARLHVDATEREELGGRRLLLSSHTNPAVQDIYDAFYSLPEEWRSRTGLEVPRGIPGSGDKNRAQFPRFDDEVARLVGWNPLSLAEVIKGTIDSFLERGLLPASA